jgi:ribonuclease-3
MAAKHSARIEELQERLGYRFKAPELLHEALTHASALDGVKGARSYNRLEFLGDRVLGLIVAERLFEETDADAGDLAPRYNALVDRHACARGARAARLGDAVLLSNSEEASGGRNKEAILADICESVIAALYLDGGMEAARAFIFRFWGDAFDDVQTTRRDAKTLLQEWTAARKLGLSYAELERSGPEHAPHFVIETRVDGFPTARGEGGSKREAQRAAAAAFLKAQDADV